jgi:hypothetical protein
LFRYRFPGSPALGQQFAGLLRREEIQQSNLLANFLAGEDDEAIEFQRWLSTRTGPNGWEIEL